MKKIFVNRLFLTGLSAYLSRLELSVDRALRQDIGLLKDYCTEKTAPKLKQVLSRLDMISAVGPADRFAVPMPPVRQRGSLSILAAWFSWYLRGGVVLTASEIQAIKSNLRQLSDALDRCQSVDPDTFVPIRLRLLEMGSLCKACIPDRKLRGKINCVEHLNQNPLLRTETIETICGHRNWLNYEST